MTLVEFSIQWFWSVATNPLLELTDDPETSGQHDKAYHSRLTSQSYQTFKLCYRQTYFLFFFASPKKETKKSRLIFMSQKTTKAVPPRKANRFTSALLHYPFFTTFLFSKFHKKQAVFLCIVELVIPCKRQRDAESLEVMFCGLRRNVTSSDFRQKIVSRSVIKLMKMLK